MFYRKIFTPHICICAVFTLIILTAFLFSCDRLGQKPEQEKVDESKVQQENIQPHSDKDPDTIILKPEAVRRAGIMIEAVSLRALKTEYIFPGRVSVNETRLAHVGPRIAGRAVEVHVNLGDYVKDGQRLAIIDSPELGDAQSQYLKAKTSLKVAEKSYERAKIVLEGKAISTGEFQRREGEYLSAQTGAKAAEDRLHLLGMKDEEIASIENTHTIDSRVAIYSPISGSVIERHLTLGEVVEPVKPLFLIADLSSLWVIADIPEKDIPKIKRGQDVAVTVSPYPERVFKGKIGYISETIDPATRTVKVRVEVDNSEGLLKPEMFASVKILTSRKENILAIPVSAVQREGNNIIVFVAKDEESLPATSPLPSGESLPVQTGVGVRGGFIFEKRVVTIGPEVDGFHQVLSGLKEGEQIVTKGAFILKSESLKELMEEE